VLSQIGIAMRLVSYSHHAMWVLPETLRHMPQVVEVYDESLLMSQLPGLISHSSSSAESLSGVKKNGICLKIGDLLCDFDHRLQMGGLGFG